MDRSLEEMQQECKTEDGLTVGLIDSAIGSLNVAFRRDLEPESVKEALLDLRSTLRGRPYIHSFDVHVESLEERRLLLRNPERTAEQNARLEELDNYVETMVMPRIVTHGSRLSPVQGEKTVCADCGMPVDRFGAHDRNVEEFDRIDAEARPCWNKAKPVPAVQGEELPELDEDDPEFAKAAKEVKGARNAGLTREEADRSLYCTLAHLRIRERQLRAYGAEIRRLKGERERLEVQLAGCGVAAEGWGLSMDNGPAVQSDYG